MNIKDHINCNHLLCSDINSNGFLVPSKDIEPEKIKILMISEVPPVNREDYFYFSDESDYMKTTIQAFKDSGITIDSINDLIDLGVYVTTAVKCPKLQYRISAKTIKKCSEILEQEINYFSNVQVYLLMGDVAIKAMNYIWKRKTGKKIIPNGSTYKIRNSEYYYEGKKVIPSYLQTGKNYLIEKTKRKMISEDIKKAFDFVNNKG
ncbi:uracil-DNA glycosylase family protein [Halothermothrix orenii]|uniref:Uracil-DNA glycosylase n=1 Tax=Halothermothrix orenii (strain H 168 / OCM 544 / DSM 9562) TaxID=373903 RepID=B8CXW7_HALOH|nr:uracil-DNA glycosylase family protein [Halothermothrix orenii]ACL70136.1 uracil-DNA glycosylase [Halothermothrix orenii H 168]